MAKVDADAADSIYHTIKILVDQDEERKTNFEPSIFRVPKTLRNVSLKSYTPCVVSIGPFHKDAELLKGAEAQKVSYVRQLFDRIGTLQEQTMKACINKVLAKIDQIKACYEGNMKAYEDHEFAKMMVIDACFIIQLIWRSTHDDYGTYSYSFFDNNLLTLYLKHDLLLLENQIPFFVLQDIFECTIKKLEPTASLANIIILFLQDMNPFRKEKLPYTDEEPNTNQNHDHILGLLQKCYHHGHGLPSQGSKTIISNKMTNVKDARSYSFTDLRLAGVKFKPNKDSKWLLCERLNMCASRLLNVVSSVTNH